MSFPAPLPRPTGTSPFAMLLKAMWDCMWDTKTNMFVDTPSLKFDKTPKGYVPVIKIPPSGGTVQLDITGEYNPGRVYSVDQVAIISMGANAGTYVYINPTASSGNAPYAGGGYWMQLPMGQLGTWL